MAVNPSLVTPAAANSDTNAAAAAAEIAGLEIDYRNNTEFTRRVELIYKITEVGTAEAIPALGRIFAGETDTELKTQVISSLADIDGQDDQKVAFLSAAVSGSQPKEVREAAIDAMTDLEAPQKGVPVLQSLSADPDSEIRDDVKDALDQITAITSATQ